MHFQICLLQLVWDSFRNCHIHFFEFEHFCSLMALLVSFVWTNKSTQKHEPLFLRQWSELLIVVNQDLILFLSPLILVLFGFFKLRQLFFILIDYSFLYCLYLWLLVRVILHDAVFDFTTLIPEKGFNGKHWVCFLELYKLANDYSDDFFQALLSKLQSSVNNISFNLV